jgi:regulator of cell morphogenesis and NO signaling
MTATALSTQDTVGQLVAQKPSRSRFFEKLGIDYCCGGKRSLADACAAKGLDANTILAVLEVADQQSEGGLVDAASMSLTALCDHIEATHHAYLRTELPRLAFLIKKVAGVHGGEDSRLVQLDDVFTAFVEELRSHMMKEEQVLFPIIRKIELYSGPQSFHCGSVNNPIAVMEHEHDNAGAALAKMRALTDDFTPPAHACNTYRAMLDALAQLEADMHQHVHKENNILFPKASELEASRR